MGVRLTCSPTFVCKFLQIQSSVCDLSIKLAGKNMLVGVHQKNDPLTGLAPKFTLVQKVLVKELLWGSRDVVQLHVPNLLLVDCAQPF